MRTDPLSTVLAVLKPRNPTVGAFDFGGDWSVQYEEHHGIKYFAVMKGSCWICVSGEAEPIRLETDDCVLLPSGRRFLISKDMHITPIHFDSLANMAWRDGIAAVNGGGGTTILGGHFAFSGFQTDMLIGTMPRILRLRDADDRTGLRWSLECMRREMVETKPGGSLIIQHLSHLLLVQALRLYLSQNKGRNVGWLFALTDSKISAAVNAMHTNPEWRWTLPLLAEKAGMSRSKFSERFKRVVGSSPIEYLTGWRMLLAGDRLIKGGESISVIATSIGYESEASFSTAFKRVMGCPPRQYVNNWYVEARLMVSTTNRDDPIV